MSEECVVLKMLCLVQSCSICASPTHTNLCVFFFSFQYSNATAAGTAPSLVSVPTHFYKVVTATGCKKVNSATKEDKRTVRIGIRRLLIFSRRRVARCEGTRERNTESEWVETKTSLSHGPLFAPALLRVWQRS